MTCRPNSVKYLQNTSFRSLSIEEKKEIKRLGRQTPDLKIYQASTSRNQSYNRKFNNIVYSQHKWLCGCPEKNALFCFPCLLFGGDATWTKCGVNDLKHLGEKIKKHVVCARHIRNDIDLAMLGTVNIAGQLSEVYRQQTIKHNEQVRRNREILSKIIDCLQFCGKYELPLHGHDETSQSSNPGVFRGLLEFAGKLDGPLKSHFLDSKVFRGTSKTVQNELLDCMLEVCRDEICAEIRESQFLSVMSDDMTDVSADTQQVIVFRYELNGAVHERFWGFFNPNSQTAEVLAECILEQLNKVLDGDNDKLIAQTYDGGAVFSGANGGVQTIIQQSYKYAYFIHCYAHQLHLTIQKAASQNSHARIFFSSLATIPAFFSKSPSRLAVLDSTSILIPQGSNTRWNFNSQLVNTVFENKESLIECLEKLLIQRNYATVQAASGILRMLNDEDFDFWLQFFHNIMPYVDILCNQLQDCNANSTSICDAINNFLEAVMRERKELPPVKIEEEEEETPLAKKRKRNSQDVLVLSAKEVCDTISYQAKERFSFTKHLYAEKLLNFSLYKDKTSYMQLLSSAEFTETIEAYPFLCKERLKTELSILYEKEQFRSASSLMKIYQIMFNTGICDSCIEVFTLVKIVLTTPMTTAELERCFSTLKRVKAFLRSTAAQDRLAALGMLSIEQAMIQNIANFNDKVIKKFSSREDRRMDFMFK